MKQFRGFKSYVLAGLVGVLTACPPPIPIGVFVFVDNQVSSADPLTPCAQGLRVRVERVGIVREFGPVLPGQAAVSDGAILGDPRLAGDITVQAWCDTGGGRVGHSRLTIPVNPRPRINVTAPDGQSRPYVVIAPGPVIDAREVRL